MILLILVVIFIFLFVWKLDEIGCVFKVSDNIVYARGLFKVQILEMVKFEKEGENVYGIVNYLDNKYREKEITQNPKETHQAIREYIKIEDEEIEFISPVAQNKAEYIAFVQSIRDNNFNEITILTTIKNKID